jgi:signal transduction histidine kinase
VSLRFVLEHRGTLFSDAPIVFSGLVVPDDIVRNAGRGLTAVKVGSAYAETLRLALGMHPSTERVFVVAKSPNQQNIDTVRSELGGFSRRVSLTFVNEETVPRLLATVKAIPRASLILFIWHAEEVPGQVVYSDTIARLVAEVATVPVYGTSDFYIGLGVVGGVVRETRETGARVGEMARQILMGTRPQDIPVETARVMPIVDWRQVQRWGISEARIPAGTRILFREPGVWERYKIYILGSVALLLAQTALIAGLLVQRARRREAEERDLGSRAALRASYERIRDLGGRLLTAQEAERSRIARELHDDVSQQVALLAIDLQLLSDADPGQGNGKGIVREASERAQDIAKSVHALSHRLHPARLQLVGLVGALNGLQREQSRPGLTITFSHEHVPAALSQPITLCLFRIAQEALQNAVKHGRAHDIKMHLSGSDHVINLTIVDNGIGFDVDAAWGKGLGLISMRERLEPFGGNLTIRSGPGTGTRIEAAVPVGVSDAG